MTHHRFMAWAGAALIGVGASLFAGTATAQVERISLGAGAAQANAASYHAAVSDDGQVVAFRSTASNLIAADTNNWPDIFVRDIAAGSTTRVGFLAGIRYSLYPSISDDGRIVVLRRGEDSTARVIAHDRILGTDTLLFAGDGNQFFEPAVSGNGQFIAFFSPFSLSNLTQVETRPLNDDTNNTQDVFVHDRIAAPPVPIERVSRDAAGDQGRGDSLSPSLSDDGRHVAFYSYADDLVAADNNEYQDVFVKDRQDASIALASVANDGTQGNGHSVKPVIAGAGGHVVFRSQASNLVAGDTNKRWDIFVRDLSLGTTERVSVANDGSQANHDSFEAGISDDGRFVVFRSNASNLVANDHNQRFDIFVHDRSNGQTLRVSLAPSGEADGNSYSPALSGDGHWIVFESDATNLVADDSNTLRDIFRVPNPFAPGGITGSGAH